MIRYCLFQNPAGTADSNIADTVRVTGWQCQERHCWQAESNTIGLVGQKCWPSIKTIAGIPRGMLCKMLMPSKEATKTHALRDLLNYLSIDHQDLIAIDTL